jgi:CspA family cold shock protein
VKIIVYACTSGNIVEFLATYALIHFISKIMQGKIKKLVTDKNFGFITPEDGGKDLFFHANELSGVSFDQLHEGDDVTFDMSDTPKGPAAVKVSLV